MLFSIKEAARRNLKASLLKKKRKLSNKKSLKGINIISNHNNNSNYRT